MKWIAVLVVAMSAVTAAPAEAATCKYGACYSHVTNFTPASPAGAVMRTTVERPDLGPSGIHSLSELSVATHDRSNVVGVGWIVSPRLNGDSDPHLFVFRWENRQPTCYNACGFVRRAGATAYPGMELEPGSEIRFRISHVGSRMAVFVNDVEIGSYPDLLWSTPWTRRLVAQSFGEVADESPAGSPEMGNGISGGQPGASRMSLRTVGRRPSCVVLSSDSRYEAVATGRCGMIYG